MTNKYLNYNHKQWVTKTSTQRKNGRLVQIKPYRLQNTQQSSQVKTTLAAAADKSWRR